MVFIFEGVRFWVVSSTPTNDSWRTFKNDRLALRLIKLLLTPGVSSRYLKRSGVSAVASPSPVPANAEIGQGDVDLMGLISPCV